ncbi:hypothetical protein [Trueperella sp. LYQ143]|uniref:hypothetical protein n=1 Tax=unclassified Trueperella TaxID=2630174 RepID=UPI00398360F2
MSTVQMMAVPDLPAITSGVDVAMTIALPIKKIVWPDGSIGLRGDDIVAIAGKIVAKSQGRWHKAGEKPDAFRTREGIPQPLGLAAPENVPYAAGQIRRGLAARFGGRPAVIITGSGSHSVRGVCDYALGSAGLDVRTAQGHAVIDAIAAMAGLLMELEHSPVVILRDVPDVMIWQDL